MIALNMIVGPYREPFLKAAFASTLGLCDQWVFVDTAPGNNPNRGYLDDIAYHFQFEDNPDTVKIIDLPRGENKDFSFAEAREVARINTDSEWVLRLDADEVLREETIPEIKDLIETAKASGIETAFYHHMVYPWLYQYIEPKVILFKKDLSRWTKGVHEVLYIEGRILRKHNLLFHHYGYCRGQEEVMKRWQLYVDIDGKPDWYKGQDPKHILDDRIAICQNYDKEHPKVVREVLNKMFEDVVPFE